MSKAKAILKFSFLILIIARPVTAMKEQDIRDRSFIRYFISYCSSATNSLSNEALRTKIGPNVYWKNGSLSYILISQKKRMLKVFVYNDDTPGLKLPVSLYQGQIEKYPVKVEIDGHFFAFKEYDGVPSFFRVKTKQLGTVVKLNRTNRKEGELGEEYFQSLLTTLKSTSIQFNKSGYNIRELSKARISACLRYMEEHPLMTGSDEIRKNFGITKSLNR